MQENATAEATTTTAMSLENSDLEEGNKFEEGCKGILLDDVEGREAEEEEEVLFLVGLGLGLWEDGRVRGLEAIDEHNSKFKH